MTCGMCLHTGDDVHKYHSWNGRIYTQCQDMVACWWRWDRTHGLIPWDMTLEEFRTTMFPKLEVTP